MKRSRTDINDAERSGRTNSAAVPENIKKVHKTVLSDSKLKLHKIAKDLKGVHILGYKWNFFIDYLEKEITINREYYMALLDQLNEK